LYKDKMNEVEKFHIDLKIMQKSLAEFEEKNENTL